MAGRFVMARFAPETLMEGGILAVFGTMVEGSKTESSLLEVVFDMSAVAALPATLFLVEAPTVDWSLSASVSAGSLAMSSLFKVLGTSAAASLPAMCFLGKGPGVLFSNRFFCLCGSSFLLLVFFAHSVVVVNYNVFHGLHFNWCN